MMSSLSAVLPETRPVPLIPAILLPAESNPPEANVKDCEPNATPAPPLIFRELIVAELVRIWLADTCEFSIPIPPPEALSAVYPVKAATLDPETVAQLFPP